MAKLYFIAATDPDDVTRNLDMFVVANDPAQAHQLWQADDFAEGCFAGPVVPDAPPLGQGDAMQIFDVSNVDPTKVGIVGWHTELKCVAHVPA